MLKQLSPLLFPLTLSLLLGGISFWLNDATELKFEAVELDPEKPQYQMTGIQAQRFNGKGIIHDALKAESAYKLPKSSEIFFRQPDIQVWEKGRPLYSVTAEEGVYRSDSRKADLARNVRMKQYAEKSGKVEAVLQSGFITIDTVTREAATRSDSDFYRENVPAQTRVKTVIYDLPKK